MRKMTTLAAAATAALLIGTALAACSSGGGSSGTTTLTVEDYYQSPQDKVMEGVYNTCGTALGVTIKATHVPGAGLIAKVLQQASAKNLPDVLMLDNPDVQQIASSGALSPLKDYGISGDGFAPAVVKAGTYKGDLYGLAPAVNSLALFYNTDMFTKAGLTPPKTWDELRSDAKQLTGNGVYGFAFSGINTYEGTWQFLPFMWTNGGDEKNIDTPQTAQALQFLVDMMNDGSISKASINWAQSDALDQFTAGKAAMMENGPWQFGSLAKFPDLHWATVPMPTRTASQTAVAPLGGEAFTVPETGDRGTMTTAGKLVKCITSSKNQVTIAQGEGDVPANLATAAKVGASNKLIQPFVEVVSHARARTGELGADWPKAATKIYTAEQLALTGKATPSAALKQAQGSN